MSEMVSMITNSALAASRDRELRENTLDVVKSAVTDALKDKGFIQAAWPL